MKSYQAVESNLRRILGYINTPGQRQRTGGSKPPREGCCRDKLGRGGSSDWAPEVRAAPYQGRD